MLKKCDGRTNERKDEQTNGRTNKQTDLCIELRYAQLITQGQEKQFKVQRSVNGRLGVDPAQLCYSSSGWMNFRKFNWVSRSNW